MLVGTALIYFGDRLLGVRLELFSGLSTFNLAWALDIFFVPFMAGMVVAVIYGRDVNHSGEVFRFSQGISMIIWVSYLPPLIVRAISYAEIYYVSGVPEGSSLMPIGLWACFVVMTMTTAGMGEIVGEVIIKGYGTTGRMKNTGNTSQAAIKDVKA